MHSLAQQGAIDPSTRRGFDKLAQQTMALPGVSQWFVTRRGWFSEDFQQYVDDLNLDLFSFDPAAYDSAACSTNDAG
jgi:hypothetical protein